MSSGKCLCGSVTWEITDTPVASYHCHCSMCRKAHGAAFGSYYFMAVKDFNWTSDIDTISRYKSSSTITRAFCKTCGSAVPNSDDENVYVPAGSHDDGPAVTEHIFTGSKAPWHDISDDLPCHELYPDGVDLEAYDDKPLAAPIEGVLRGSCLCDAVAFNVTEPFKAVHNCHCSRCRQARSAVHATNGFTSIDGVQFTKGEKYVRTYKVPTARYFTHAFCDVCGSGLPRHDPERKIAIVPLSALDDDPGHKADDHIHVGSKAQWYDVTGDLPIHDQGPPG